MGFEAESRGGKRQHSSELAAAKNPDAPSARARSPNAKRDDDFGGQARCAIRIGCHALRRRMRRADLALEGHSELIEYFCGSLQGGPVGLTAHDEANERFGHASVSESAGTAGAGSKRL